MKHILCFFILAGLVNNDIQSQTDWQQKYDELSERVKKHENQPPGSENRLEEYLHWMGVHAMDRDEIAVVIEELHPLAIEDPDGDHALWERLFIGLLERAKWSGYSTIRAGSERLLNVEEGPGSYIGWFTSIWKAKSNGRALFSRAIETHWDQSIPRNYVECLIINAIRDIEHNEGGLGIYLGREGYHGYIDDEGNSRFWEHDFTLYCETRDKFYVVSEGEPHRPISWAFSNIHKIREECDWWNFPDHRQDATDLMNQYYEDALCKQPPHKQKHGHHYFLELAREYALDKSVKYNEGFYGTLYGKVEILDGGTKTPASGAKVTIQDYDQTWTVMTDENGYYESPNTILHKDCSPFYIKAVHNGDWVNDTYEGILSEPDPTARLEKNLVIERVREYEWYGNVALMHSDQLDCTVKKTTGDESSINKKQNQFQDINFDLQVKGHELLEGGLAMLSEENMAASGYVDVNLKSEYELKSYSPAGYTYEYTKETGQDVYKIEAKDIIVQIFKEQNMDPEAMAKKLQEAMEKGLDDPDAMDKILNEMEASMSGQNQKQIPVKVIIRLNKTSSGKLHLYKYRETGDAVNKPVVKEEDGEVGINMPILLSFAIEGNYIKEDSGEDRIIATYDEITPNEAGEKDCNPPGSTTNSFTFELVRKRLK